MGSPRSGKNGLIYISGVEIGAANQWSLSISQNPIRTDQFGDTWANQVANIKTWQGNITAWEHEDSNTIVDAATAGTSVALLIYPDTDNASNYYSGNAIFGVNGDGGTTSAISQNGDFVGDGALTVNGYT